MFDKIDLVIIATLIAIYIAIFAIPRAGRGEPAPAPCRCAEEIIGGLGR